MSDQKDYRKGFNVLNPSEISSTVEGKSSYTMSSAHNDKAEDRIEMLVSHNADADFGGDRPRLSSDIASPGYVDVKHTEFPMSPNSLMRRTFKERTFS